MNHLTLTSLLLTLLISFTFSFSLFSQSLYFPPDTGPWETLNPAQLNWCSDKLDSLHAFVGEANTQAFIVLKDGKIVLEWYYNDFSQDSLWYWASAGKTVTAALVGIAQEAGHLDIQDPTSDYLGTGWTDCALYEPQITIRNQLTMTSGLDDGVPDNHCTLDTCLQCLAEPGTRWAYHNAPYTKLRDVLESATGQNINLYFKNTIGDKIGATGAFIPAGFNNVFFSTPRSMARFGLMILAGGQWESQAVISDTAYFQDMITTSQSLNKAYGYLWWLNGKGEHMLPGLQLVFPSDLIPAAPDDLFAALGKNDQKIYVLPSEQMVVIRMGDAAGPPAPASSSFDNQLWERLVNLECAVTSVEETISEEMGIRIFPNPARGRVYVDLPSGQIIESLELHSLQGRMLRQDKAPELSLSGIPAGMYLLRLKRQGAAPLIKRLLVRE